MSANGLLGGAICVALLAGVSGGFAGGLIGAVCGGIFGGIVGGAFGIATYDFFSRSWKKMIGKVNGDATQSKIRG